MTSSYQQTDSNNYGFTYSYKLAGEMTSETYPSGRQVTTEYDTAGRIAGVKKDATTYYAGATASDPTNRIQYAPQGAVSAMKLGNGKWEHTSFNNRLQPTQIGLGTSATNSSLLQLDYTYNTTGQADNNGNLLTQRITIGSTVMSQTYAYDTLNRLQTATESGAWTQTYDCDRYGNRAVRVGSYIPTPALTPQSGSSTDFSAFNQGNNRIQLSGFGYDASGNLKNDPTTAANAMLYDAENHQVSYTKAGTTTYSYDGDGHRVKKIDSSGTTVFVYNVGGQLIAEYTSGTPSGGGTSYLTSDHLGSTRVVTKSDGSVKARYDYLPFGEEIGSGIGARTTGMGYGAADGTRQKFTQKERDSESGLDYFLARYYSSAQGRFTSTDAIYFQKEMLADPQRFNLYGYVRNNPLRFVDPTGLILQISVNGDPDTVKDWLRTLAGNLASELVFNEVKDNNGNIVRYDVQFNVSDKEIANIEGAKLVHDLVSSDKVFLAQSGGEAEFKSKNDPRGIIHTRNADEDPGNITRNRPGPSGGAEPADPKVDSIILVSRTITFVDRGGQGEAVERISFFIHEASEAYLLAQGVNYGSAHGFRYGQFAPAHGPRTKYVLPWNNAISREARIRLELDIKGGFAGGDLRRKQ